MQIEQRSNQRILVIDGTEYELPDLPVDALIHVYSDGTNYDPLIQAQGQPEEIHGNPSFSKIQTLELGASSVAVLNEQKKEAQAQCDKKRGKCIDEGFIFEGVHYQTRPTDRENISGAALLATQVTMQGVGAAGDYRWQDANNDFEWIATDNSIIKMDAPTTMAFGQSAAAYKQNLIILSRQIKNQIAAAETVDEIQQIMDSAPWPTQ